MASYKDCQAQIFLDRKSDGNASRATSLLCNFSERKTITNSITFFMKKITNSRTATHDCNWMVLQAKNITISGNYFQFQLDNVIDITNIIATLQGNIFSIINLTKNKPQHRGDRHELQGCSKSI